MSDRDRPEWQIAFTLAAGYDEQDAIELYEQIEGSPCVSGAALAAADAVQDRRTIYDCAFNNARYAQPCDRCPAQPADDRRMVNLDAVLAALRDPENQKGGHLISFSHAARFIERELGGTAPSEDQP